MSEINVTPPPEDDPKPGGDRGASSAGGGRGLRIPGAEIPGRVARSATGFVERRRLSIVILGFVTALVVLLCWKRIFIKIGPGEAGVVYRLFQGGTVVNTVYPEGLRLVCPWNTMYIYNMRVQQVSDSFTVLSQDGLTLRVEVSIRFKPQPELLGILHKEIGPDYVEKVVKPMVQADIRFVMGQYKPDQIYTSQGFIVQTAVQAAAADLASRYILLDDLLVKNVSLPPTVAFSIESKLRAQQLSEEFDYRLQTETKEAERKRIEAAGIRDFQTVLTEPVTSEQYLRYKGIEATEELAKSLNPKTVVIGGGDDRLSLILDEAGRNGAAQPPAVKPAPSVSGPPPYEPTVTPDAFPKPPPATPPQNK